MNPYYFNPGYIPQQVDYSVQQYYPLTYHSMKNTMKDSSFKILEDLNEEFVLLRDKMRSKSEKLLV